VFAMQHQNQKFQENKGNVKEQCISQRSIIDNDEVIQKTRNATQNVIG